MPQDDYPISQPSDPQPTEGDNVSTTSRRPNSSASQANKYGFLKPMEVTMMATGGAINTGLMIGAGNALSKAGPASILISYTVIGMIVYLVLGALGEVASSFPEPSTVAGHAVRFCDPALGFTLGWIYWLKYIVVTPNQLTAAALLISYWLDAKSVNPGVWITAFLVIIVAANYWGTRFLGQYEVVLSSFKIIVVFALTILSLVIALGGGPDHDRKGFRYWKDPGAFATYGSATVVGKLRAIGRTITSTTFAYLGSELLGMTIIQTENPPKAATRAVKLTFYRVIIFNIVMVTLLGMLIPYDSHDLAFANNASKPTTASAFVVAVRMANIPILPSILNACFLLFVLSSANQALYMATKSIYGLSQEKKAPAILSRTDRRGIPIYALALCSGLASLAYLNISSDSKVLFGYFINMVTMFGLLTWISILIAHISFVRARKAQKIPDNTLAFKAPFGPFGSWVALGCCIVISLMRCFDATHQTESYGEFDYKTFTTSYLGIPLYLILVLGYKAVTRYKNIPPERLLFGLQRGFRSGGAQNSNPLERKRTLEMNRNSI